MQAIRRLRMLLVAIAAIGAVTLGMQSVAAKTNGGVTGPAFYVDGQLYRTVNTPTDLTNTGAPIHSFDVIYDFGGVQMNVATVAPGYPGYNGGRWQVHGLTFANYGAAVMTYDANGSGNFDSAAEVQAAIAGGAATDLGVVKLFVCPVIKVPNSA